MFCSAKDREHLYIKSSRHGAVSKNLIRESKSLEKEEVEYLRYKTTEIIMFKVNKMDHDAAYGVLSRKHEMVVKQIVYTTESLFPIVELAITRSKMGPETYFF